MVEDENGSEKRRLMRTMDTMADIFIVIITKNS